MISLFPEKVRQTFRKEILIPKYVVMHSDGYTWDILHSLADIGVNAINTQIFCMDIEKLAKEGRAVIPFPKMFSGGGYDFSYSGLKTAVINYCHNTEQKGESYSKADVAASFQSAACAPLAERAVAAAKQKGADTVVAGGGVIANGYLRALLQRSCEKAGLKLVLPEKKYCTDNAAMIAAEGLIQYRAGNFAELSLNARAHIPLGKKGKQ